MADACALLLLKRESSMRTDLKKSMVGGAVLVALGVIAIYSGVMSLTVLLPAAILVYYEWSASLRRSKDHTPGPAAGNSAVGLTPNGRIDA